MADVSIIVDKNGTEFSIADAPARADVAELSADVSAIELKIPSDASASNQMVTAASVGTWTRKLQATPSIAPNTSYSARVLPSEGKKIVAVGYCAIESQTNWGTTSHLRRFEFLDNGGVEIFARSIVGTSSVAQGYMFCVDVLEV